MVKIHAIVYAKESYEVSAKSEAVRKAMKDGKEVDVIRDTETKHTIDYVVQSVTAPGSMSNAPENIKPQLKKAAVKWSGVNGSYGDNLQAIAKALVSHMSQGFIITAPEHLKNHTFEAQMSYLGRTAHVNYDRPLTNEEKDQLAMYVMDEISKLPREKEGRLKSFFKDK